MFDVKECKRKWAQTPQGKESLKRAQNKYNQSEHGKMMRKRIEQSEGRKRTMAKYSRSEKGKENSKRGQDKYRKTLNGRFKLAQKTAKRRELSWEINEYDYKKLITQNCFYCNNSLALGGVGLDRLDNSGGYSNDNVVPCCPTCNKARGNWWTPEETKVAIRAVYGYRRGIQGYVLSKCEESDR